MTVWRTDQKTAFKAPSPEIWSDTNYDDLDEWADSYEKESGWMVSRYNKFILIKSKYTKYWILGIQS